jgi:hypothetical protein
MACDAVKRKDELPNRSDVNADLSDVLLDMRIQMAGSFGKLLCDNEDVNNMIDRVGAIIDREINETIDKLPPKQGGNELPIESITPKVITATAMLFGMWSGLPKVSRRTVPILASKYTLIELFYIDSEEIANLTFDNGRKLGIETAKKILTGMRDVIVVSDILTGVKGVSKELATQIARDFTFDKLNEIPKDYKFKGRKITSKSKLIKEMINKKMIL